MDEADLVVVTHNRKTKTIAPSVKGIRIPGKVLLGGKLDPPTGLHMTDLHDMVLAHNECPYPTFKGMGAPTDKHARYLANTLTIRTTPTLIDCCCILGAPPTESWLCDIDNDRFSSWPGLTSVRVRKYGANKPQTLYDHMQSQWQHVDSTKTANDMSLFPPIQKRTPTQKTSPAPTHGPNGTK